MQERLSIPTIGITLALITAAVLAMSGADAALTIVVLIVWIGSLFLASLKPPKAIEAQDYQAVSRDTIGEMIEHANALLLVTERNKVTLANRSARKLLGGHIVGQDIRVIFRQPDAIALLDSERNGGTIVRGLVRRRDIWRLNRQKVGKAMAVVELTNQTAEADISRAHTDFVANASHELRTPLAAIIGYVETLRENQENLDSTTAARFLETIQREAERMRSLISDLMSLSRVEAEKHDHPKQSIELAAVVERAARDAAGSERAKRLDLAIQKDLIVSGDVQQLEQLVRNLVDNAMKYGEEDSPVTVRLEAGDGGNAWISVEDRGEGIPEEHLPHLTRRFYRTDPGRSRASGGTGLGLAIVKHIVERHRGRLDISSEIGKGTVVQVRLPLTSAE